MRLALFQSQLCTICDQSVEDHTDDCPYGRMKRLDEKRPNIECTKCSGRVEVNVNDYYECRNCGTQFSRSGFHEEMGWERICLIDRDNDRAITVLIMPDKGSGLFKIDRSFKEIQEEIDARIARTG